MHGDDKGINQVGELPDELPLHEGQRFPTSTFLGSSTYEVIANTNLHNSENAAEPADESHRLSTAYFTKFCSSIQTMLVLESGRGTGFLLLPIALGSGIITYFSLNFEPGWGSLLSASLIVSVTLFAARSRVFIKNIALLSLVFCIGLLVAKSHTEMRPMTMLGSAVSTKITGEVVALSTLANGSFRLEVIVETTQRPVLRYSLNKIRVTARDLPANIQLGDYIEGIVRLRPSSGPVRPHNYDFAFNNFYQGNDASGFFLGVPKIITKPETRQAEESPEILTSIKRFISNLRFTITEKIEEQLSGENGAIASALITGYRTGITEKTNEALRDAGLAHVLSISGLHLALAAGVVMIGIRSLAALFPKLSAKYPVKKFAAFASLLSSAFYLGISGADVAAQRSFLMVAIMLVSVMFDRSAISMRNLSIAALVILVVSPSEIVGPSFQMSFAATAALIAIYAWWSQQKKQASGRGDNEKYHRKTRLGWGLNLIQKTILGTAVTSIAAGVASGLFAAYHFNNTAPFGLLGNILAMPVISLIIMPFAVLSILLMPFYLEWLPLQIMGLGITLMKKIAYGIASIAPEGNPGMMTSFTLIIFSLALLVAVIATTRLKLLAVPLCIIGLLSFLIERNPDVIISEDAKLVVILNENGVLAVNRTRPSLFTINNWYKSYKATEITKPILVSQKPNDKVAEDMSVFTCEQDLCLYNLSSHRILAYTDKPESVEIACNIADVVILAVSAQYAKCLTNPTILLTRQDLALRGALEIRFSPNWLREKPSQEKNYANIKTQPEHEKNKMSGNESINEVANLKYAVGVPQRPWQFYRLYSRAARGLPDM